MSVSVCLGLLSVLSVWKSFGKKLKLCENKENFTVASYSGLQQVRKTWAKK